MINVITEISALFDKMYFMNTSKNTIDVDTPLMNQYKEIKEKHSDSIVFFRLGDFYEMFGEDALIASKILGIVLTKRQDVPMCGVPYHSAPNYISKLIKNGYKVAICEQIGEEDRKTKIFKRDVVRIITPGTVIEESLLNSKTANYLASIIFDTVGWGVAWIDPSSGQFMATNLLGRLDLQSFTSLITRINPSEIIANSKTALQIKELGIKLPLKIEIFESTTIKEEWTEESVWKNNPLALKAAVSAAEYIKKVMPSIKQIPAPIYFNDDKNLKLDETALRTLEIIEPQYPEGMSVADVLDYSQTPMGSRMLRRWLSNPLSDYYMIKKRLDEVNFLVNNREILENLSQILANIPDIERIYGRVVNLSITPHDCLALKKAISNLEKIHLILENDLSTHFGDLKISIEKLNELKRLGNLLHTAIDENSSLKVGEGDLFKEGWNSEYDELKKLVSDTQSIIRTLESKEREKTGIQSLKIGYNSTFGYYIEVTKPHLSKVPPNYIRKQTLVSGERFITEELKTLEEKILSAGEKIKKLEIHLFNEIKKAVLENSSAINSYAWLIAYLDTISSFAWAAVKNGYVMPEITTENIIEIEDCRHPVVEKFVDDGKFVPNDIKLDETTRTLIITGPNMSGKSVYLRQNAIAVIMAQAGSFVAAKSAKIGIVDRIMTRIGAFDRLARGESTFMVEMKETSQILRLATPKSLILLDEVGRGTSTFDGISIAYAVLEYIHTKIKAKTLFATHFFEITELADRYNGIKNVNIAVKEWTNSNGKTEITFLHRVVDGVCDKSYGIHVAQIAGLPHECIHRAKKILQELQSRTIEKDNDESFLPIFSSHPIIDKLKLIDTQRITPIEALNILNDLKNEI